MVKNPTKDDTDWDGRNRRCVAVESSRYAGFAHWIKWSTVWGHKRNIFQNDCLLLSIWNVYSPQCALCVSTKEKRDWQIWSLSFFVELKIRNVELQTRLGSHFVSSFIPQIEEKNWKKHPFGTVRDWSDDMMDLMGIISKTLRVKTRRNLSVFPGIFVKCLDNFMSWPNVLLCTVPVSQWGLTNKYKW